MMNLPFVGAIRSSRSVRKKKKHSLLLYSYVYYTILFIEFDTIGLLNLITTEDCF